VHFERKLGRDHFAPALARFEQELRERAQKTAPARRREDIICVLFMLRS
jgi:hypothetical protein